MDEKLKMNAFGVLNPSRRVAVVLATSLFTLAPLSAMAGAGNDLNANKSLAVQQDKKTVTGTVVDTNGEPIIGATVREVGSQTATITDVNGNFKLSVKSGAMLSVSSIGFKEQTVKAGANVTVTLQDDAEVLDQVVVVGYGTAKRKDVSGAITSVKFDDGKITNLPNPNALAALSSQVAGLRYAPTSSASGDNSGTMTLRGKNVIPSSPSASAQGNNAPLLIVDGVISYGGINEINTNDIATIDVLKDASAAAIYGSRAANGVIIITTKRGASAQPTVRFNTQWSFSDWSRSPKMVEDKERFLMNRFYAKKAAGDNRIPEDQEWSMDFFNANRDVFFVTTQEMQAYEAGQWVNWLDEVTRTGVGQQYDVSVAGGSKGVKYYLSGDYSRRQGVQIGDDYEKYNILSKIDIDVTSWLKVGLKANYLGWRQWGVTATLGNAEWYSPFSWKTVQSDDPKYASWPNSHPDGNTLSPLWGSGVNDGVADSNLYGVNDKNGNNVNGVLTAQVDFPFLKGLSYRFTLNAQRNSSYQDTFNKPEMWVDTRNTAQMDDPTQFNNKVRAATTTRKLGDATIYLWGDDAACYPEGVQGGSSTKGASLTAANRYVANNTRDSIGGGYAYGSCRNYPCRYVFDPQEPGYIWAKATDPAQPGREDIRGSETMMQRNWYTPSGKPWSEIYKATKAREAAAIGTANESVYKLSGGDTIDIFPRFWKFAQAKHPGGSAKECEYEPYMIRVAETYLLRAEAYLAKGDTQKAADDINVVRARANAPLCSASEVDIDYILDERTRELFGEEHRCITLNRLSCNPNCGTYVTSKYPTQNENQSNTLYERVRKYGVSFVNETESSNADKGRIKVEYVKNDGTKGIRFVPNIQPYNYQQPIPDDVIKSNSGAEYPQNYGY